MCLKGDDPSQGTTASVLSALGEGLSDLGYWKAMVRPWPLAWQRSEATGVPAPARHAAALRFITYQFLLKRKPYKFNQLFIWKHLTFFPLELFDIIVLRVRIKKKKTVKMCDSSGHPFLAGVQVSFPVDSSLKCTGVSANCLAR